MQMPKPYRALAPGTATLNQLLFDPGLLPVEYPLIFGLNWRRMSETNS